MTSMGLAFEKTIFNWNKNKVSDVSIHMVYFFPYLFDLLFLPMLFPLPVGLWAILCLSVSLFSCISPLPFCLSVFHSFFLLSQLFFLYHTCLFLYFFLLQTKSTTFIKNIYVTNSMLNCSWSSYSRIISLS